MKGALACTTRNYKLSVASYYRVATVRSPELYLYIREMARIRGPNRGRRPFATPDRYVHMQLCIPHFRTSIPGFGLARSELAPVECMIEARGAPRGRTSIDNSHVSARCVRQ